MTKVLFDLKETSPNGDVPIDAQINCYPVARRKDGAVQHSSKAQYRLSDSAFQARGAFTQPDTSGSTVFASLPWWSRPGVYVRASVAMGSVQGYFDVATGGDMSRWVSVTTPNASYVNTIWFVVR